MNITITSSAYADKTWERIKAARAAAESAGFLFNGVRYDSDPASLQRISSAVTLAMLAQSAGQPFAIDWTVADNSVVALDAAGIIGVGLACGQYIAGVFGRARALREQIEATTTADELDAIVW